MRVAMVGLGAIARKAYLPVLAARPGLEVVLCTRDGAVLRELASSYRLPIGTRDVAELPALGIDGAFVHTATEAHAQVAGVLLEAGIPVYIDKPLAYDYATAAALVERAERAGALLMVGFNRRFAPMVRRVKEAGGARLVLMQKNRVGLPDTVRRVVFDDFIHVADTLRHLAPADAAPVLASGHLEAGRLHHLVVHLQATGFTGIGIMNRDGGAAEEILEVTRPGEKHVLRNLDELTRIGAGEDRHYRAADWTSVLERRGFPAIVEHFLACVGGTERPAQRARDALETHALCEWIVERIEAGAEAGDGAASRAGRSEATGPA